MEILHSVLGFWWVIPIVLALVFYRLVLRLFGVVMVPDDSIGVVTKKFVLFGSNKTLPDGAIVALKGEAGVQADTLAPGVHFFLWPWQYDIEMRTFVTVDNGHLGVIEARDGKSLPSGRVLGTSVECDLFQDARKFLEQGGQRGPQMTVVPPGTYRINTGLFKVTIAPVTEIDDKMVGVVTVKDGAALREGDIAGKIITTDHKSFQDGDAFLRAGGFRGLQEEVLRAGRYYLNPLFVEVETVPMTLVPIATAGVMISYVGEHGEDQTGVDFTNGNLVLRGHKGVWVDPLDPGKYPINPFTHKLENVPTANIVLNWATGKNESHNLDEHLRTIDLRTIDGFTVPMDVSIILHIPRNDAPKVISRFGTLLNLVTQVLEPMIANYFRNAAQRSDALKLLQERIPLQESAKGTITKALAECNVKCVDVLIGDIVPPPDLAKTLTDRQIAEQQKVTFVTQQQAAEAQKSLEQARAIAATQSRVVDAERKVTIAEFDAKAAVENAKGAAEAKNINATADANVLRTVGEAEAAKVQAVGDAEASVIQKKTTAIGASNFALIETARAISESGQALVPHILVGGGGKEGGSDNLVQLLLAKAAASGELSGASKKSEPAATEKPVDAVPPPPPVRKPETTGNGTTA